MWHPHAERDGYYFLPFAYDLNSTLQFTRWPEPSVSIVGTMPNRPASIDKHKLIRHQQRLRILNPALVALLSTQVLDGEPQLVGRRLS